MAEIRILPVLGRMLALLCLVLALPAAAQQFPALTAPVVDAANVLPADAKSRISAKLIALKQQSQRQLQVVTVASLEGYDINDYANRLFRNAQLGDKTRNDGAMLLIAPHERKLRIEVGYGLEGIVTDGLSFLIINNAIVPKFKAGDMPGGIEAGADALIQQLTLPEAEARKIAAAAKQKQQDKGSGFPIIFFIFVFFFFILPMLRRARGGRSYSSGLGPVIVWDALNSGGGSSWSSGGGMDWGGGGGSSGGGGASGDW